MSSTYGNRGPTGGVAGRSGGAGGGNVIPKGYEYGQIQQFTPEMMQLFQSLFGHLGEGSYLSRLAGGDEELFNQIERPAQQQFSGLQGNLASRFSGMGLGARHSSGFQNTANSAASDFASQLQSQRQGLQREALQSLFGMSNQLLGQRPYDQFITEKPPSWLESLLGGVGALGGQFGGSLLGGLGGGLGNKWAGGGQSGSNYR